LPDNACPLPQLKEYIVKYQDPTQADSIMKIQKELDETKIVLHKTIESVLERGEKIDTLVAKSDGLSAQSKMFYTQVRSGRPKSVYFASIFKPLTVPTTGQETELMLRHHVRGYDLIQRLNECGSIAAWVHRIPSWLD